MSCFTYRDSSLCFHLFSFCVSLAFCSQLLQIPRYILVFSSNCEGNSSALSGLSLWRLLLLILLRPPSWNPLLSWSMNLASFLLSSWEAACFPVWVFPHPRSVLGHLTPGSWLAWLVGWFYTIFYTMFSWTASLSKSREGTPQSKMFVSLWVWNVFIPPPPPTPHSYLLGSSISCRNAERHLLYQLLF